MDAERIRHTVSFTLVHPPGSDGERDFLQAAERYGLGLDYDRRLPGLLRAVSLDEVRAAAEEVLNPDVATVATAGAPAVR